MSIFENAVSFWWKKGSYIVLLFSAVCPVGFISSDGLPTCTPCPEDHYWVNTTYCEPCPNSCSTAGKNAITDITGCKGKSSLKKE